MTPEDMAMNLSFIVATMYDLLLVAIMYSVKKCYGDEIPTLGYVSVISMFAFMLITIAAASNRPTLLYLGASTLALAIATAIYYVYTRLKKCR